MGGRTGYPDLTNAIGFGFAEYIEPVEDHFDALIDPSVPTPSDLPAANNWLGRTFYVESTKQLAVCTALPGTWSRTPVSPPWAQNVRAATDSYSNGAFRNIHNVTISNAVDGVYEWDAVLYLGASVANAGNARMLIGTTNLLGADPPFDFTASTRQVFAAHGFYTHTGGTLTLAAYDNRSAGTGTIYAGSTLTLKYVSGS